MMAASGMSFLVSLFAFRDVDPPRACVSTNAPNHSQLGTLHNRRNPPHAILAIFLGTSMSRREATDP